MNEPGVRGTPPDPFRASGRPPRWAVFLLVGVFLPPVVLILVFLRTSVDVPHFAFVFFLLVAASMLLFLIVAALSASRLRTVFVDSAGVRLSGRLSRNFATPWERVAWITVAFAPFASHRVSALVGNDKRLIGVTSTGELGDSVGQAFQEALLDHAAWHKIPIYFVPSDRPVRWLWWRRLRPPESGSGSA